MIEKKAYTIVPINEILAKRWSCRAFALDKPVIREDILSLCEAARWAPSCYGDEPWRFIICDKYQNLIAYKKAFACLGDWNQRWVKNVPVLIISMSYGKFRKNGKVNRWAQYDSGAAAENLCLQAVSLGLMAHQMGGFDAGKVKSEFIIPEDITINAIIAVGYQQEADVLEEEFQKSEKAERIRKPLGDNFFDGEFGKAIL